MHKVLKKIGFILLNILSVGAVFGYFKRPGLSIFIQIAALILTLTLSYVALFSSWIMALASVLFLIYVIFISKLTLRIYEGHQQKSAKLFLCFAVTSFLILPLANLVRPSMSFSMPDNHWEPSIQEGEHFLAHLHPKRYASGDFVIIKREDGSLVVRRVQKIEDETALLELPPKDGVTEKVPTEQIYAKVLYIYFSWSPERLFKWL